MELSFKSVIWTSEGNNLSWDVLLLQKIMIKLYWFWRVLWGEAVTSKCFLGLIRMLVLDFESKHFPSPWGSCLTLSGFHSSKSPRSYILLTAFWYQWMPEFINASIGINSRKLYLEKRASDNLLAVLVNSSRWHFFAVQLNWEAKSGKKWIHLHYG